LVARSEPTVDQPPGLPASSSAQAAAGGPRTSSSTAQHTRDNDPAEITPTSSPLPPNGGKFDQLNLSIKSTTLPDAALHTVAAEALYDKVTLPPADVAAETDLPNNLDHGPKFS
jgi:hypothetical protein